MTGLKFFRKETFEVQIHRAGWNWVIQHMHEKYHDDNAEVLVDDFIEKTFDWDYMQLKEKGDLPHYSQPWIGFVHNPFICPKPFDIKASALNICSRLPFLKSLKTCKGLYVLSEDLAESLRYLLGSFGADYINVEVIMHPTVTDVKLFDINKFESSPKISNIGYWLRDFTPYFLLDTSMPKHILLGKLQYARDNYTMQLSQFKEKSKLTGEKRLGNIIPQQALSNEDYDEFLTSSISFLNLIDTSANNGVIECIARNIPLLVNAHSAVVEYLGKDYPFYYMSQEGANKKINDISLIKETHEYLKGMDKRFLEIEEFLYSFEYSDIYNNL